MTAAGALRCLLIVLVLTACDGPSSTAAATASLHKRVVHEVTDATTGLSSTYDGFTFDSEMSSIVGDQDFHFRILGPDGQPQVNFLPEQTKLIHLYGVRDDLTDFIHVHPELVGAGEWSAQMPPLRPGPDHVYATFLIRDGVGKLHQMVLSRPLMVPGSYQFEPIPAPSSSASVDGYEFSWRARPKAWTVLSLPARITFGGQPVVDLQSYLDAYAHMTTVRAANHALGHAHPLELVTPNHDGGPGLTFHTEFPDAGAYRVFIQFMTAGRLHTAELTVQVE